MALTYIPLLPTVLVDARLVPTGMAQAHWMEDATTRLYTPLPPPPPAEDRPVASNVGREMIEKAGISPRELNQLEIWMDSRGLRAGFYTSAMEYLGRMRRDSSAASEPKEYYIGCGLSDDLQIQDPYMRPRHLSVLPDVKGRYWIRNRFLHTDAYLTRGNADPEPLPHEDRLRLMPGDIITVGDTHLEFQLDGRRARFVRVRPPVVFASDGPTRIDIRRP